MRQAVLAFALTGMLCASVSANGVPIFTPATIALLETSGSPVLLPSWLPEGKTLYPVPLVINPMRSYYAIYADTPNCTAVRPACVLALVVAFPASVLTEPLKGEPVELGSWGSGYYAPSSGTPGFDFPSVTFTHGSTGYVVSYKGSRNDVIRIARSMITASASRPSSVAEGESKLELFEQSMSSVPKENWASTIVFDYLKPRNAQGVLDSAADGRAVTARAAPVYAVADSKRGLLALTHPGAVPQNTLTKYKNVAALGLPDRDLSKVTTALGIRIGSTSQEVKAIHGVPKPYRTVKGETAYAYTHALNGCETGWIIFVFDKSNRVEAISDGIGC